MTELRCGSCGFGPYRTAEVLHCENCGELRPIVEVAAPEPVVEVSEPEGPTIREKWCATADILQAGASGSPFDPRSNRPAATGVRWVIDGDGGLHVLQVGSGLGMGRASANAVVAARLGDFANVSAHHLALQVDEQGLLVLCDLESTNGTYLVVDGRLDRLQPRSWMPIAPGTVLQLGNSPGRNARLRIDARRPNATPGVR